MDPRIALNFDWKIKCELWNKQVTEWTKVGEQTRKDLFMSWSTGICTAEGQDVHISLTVQFVIMVHFSCVRELKPCEKHLCSTPSFLGLFCSLSHVLTVFILSSTEFDHLG